MRDAAINLRARPEQRDLIDRAAELLDAPPVLNPGFKRLLAVKAPWGKKSAKA